MDIIPYHQLLLRLSGLGTLLILSAIFSGSETALCALTRVEIERIRGEKRKSSRAIINFVDNPRRLFITILLGNTFINTAFATITASMIGHSGMGFIIATVVITILLLLFGEITPKTYAIKYAEKFARYTAYLLWILSVVITPLRAILRSVTDLLLPIFGGSNIPKTDRMTAEDLKAIINRSADEEDSLRDEGQMLSKILELREIDAKEIMVPRTEIVAVKMTSTIQELIEISKKSGHSRIPIFRNQLDQIYHVFNMKNLVSWHYRWDIRSLTIEEFMANADEENKSDSLKALFELPYFVLETKKIAKLLRELIDRKIKVAILIDEFGGISGLASVEDILEEIVGEIVDEHDIKLPLAEIERTDHPQLLKVSGRASVRHFNERFQTNLEEELADTIGGYAFGLFGRIPAVGDEVMDENGIKFQVVEMANNLIVRLTVRLTP